MSHTTDKYLNHFEQMNNLIATFFRQSDEFIAKYKKTHGEPPTPEELEILELDAYLTNGE